MRVMANRIRRSSEALAAGRRLQSDLGTDLRDARLARGLRQTDVARFLGVSHARIGRVERGVVRTLGLADTASHGACVGLRLYARLYPAAGGLRDAAQLALLRRFRIRVGDAWRWQLEAPLNIAGDLRAFDALLTAAVPPAGAPVTIAVEAITRLRDAQAQLRAANLKQRDGRVPRLVMLIGASHANRAALRSAADLLATTFPLGTRATLAALTARKDPGANAIVLL